MTFRDWTEPSRHDDEADVADVADVSGGGDPDLLSRVEAFVRRFVVFPDEHCETAVVLWIMHAHKLDDFFSTPRLAILSPEPGSGKTRVQEVVELLVPDPMATFNVSAAVLYRSMGGNRRPTILLDEADTIFGPRASKDHEDLRGFINSGYRMGAKAQRCANDGKRITIEEFPSYAAVCIAGLDDLPDTIMTRSIVIRMQRRTSNEKVESFRRRLVEPEGHALRSDVAQWASSVDLSQDFPHLPPGVEDRAAECWEPLVAIADAMGGDWPDRARDAAQHFVNVGRDNSQSLNIRLLTDLKAVFDADAHDHLPTTHLLDRLHAMDEAPWSDLRGKPLAALDLSRRLSKYGIKPVQVRIGEKNLRGYRREDLHDAWERYLPSPPADAATSATSATRPTMSEPEGAQPDEPPSIF